VTVIERFNYQALDVLGMLVKGIVVIEPNGEKTIYRIIPQSRPNPKVLANRDTNAAFEDYLSRMEQVCKT
jgi:hypothetical protein